MWFFGSPDDQKSKDKPDISSRNQAIVDTLNRAMAVVEFTCDGHILNANPIFLEMIGYSLDDIRGQHHGMLCEPEIVRSEMYQQFWRDIAAGQVRDGRFRRRKRNGEQIWLRASYGPIFDENHRVTSIIKFASDITSLTTRTNDMQSRLQALDRSTAVIEFNLDGTIISANQNFLDTTGYRLEEVTGKHHRIFCTPEFAQSHEYQAMWQQLNQGKFVQGQFERRHRNGNPIWLEATYNPVFDLDGKLYKVIKIATDITENVEKNRQEAHNAVRAYEITSDTEKIALSGTEIIQNAAGEMQRIAETVSHSADQISELGRQSEQITAIVNTIRGIADQTNLLALNAAIEAARAGDQGRGFAVVADEVRSLAGRTAQSTHEISAMIEKIQNGTEVSIQQMNLCQSQAQRGVGLAQEAGKVILKIRDGSREAVQAVSVFVNAIDGKAKKSG